MIEESRVYWTVVLTLAVLVSVALWQFHSLVRDDSVRGPAIASAPLSLPEDPLTGLATR